MLNLVQELCSNGTYIRKSMGEIHEGWFFMLELSLIKHFLNCNIDRENNIDLNRE